MFGGNAPVSYCCPSQTLLHHAHCCLFPPFCSEMLCCVCADLAGLLDKLCTLALVGFGEGVLMMGVGTNLRTPRGDAEGPCEHLCCDWGSSGRCSEEGGESSVASCPEELSSLSPRAPSCYPGWWPPCSIVVPTKMMLCVAPSFE